jgi:metallo-beta-lactamase class B
VLFACSLTVAGQPLAHDTRYPEAAADFRRSFARLKRHRADIFLTFHSAFFDLEPKRRRLLAGNPNAFVDPSELPRRVASAEAAFEKELARQQTARPTHNRSDRRPPERRPGRDPCQGFSSRL